MNAQEIINYIANSEKKTPVKLYVNTLGPVDFGSAKVFGQGNSFIVFGDWGELAAVLEANAREGRGTEKFAAAGERIKQARGALKAPLSALHKKRRLGVSVYEGIIYYLQNKNAPDIMDVESSFYDTIT